MYGVVNVRTGLSSTTKSSSATQGERTVHTVSVGVSQKECEADREFTLDLHGNQTRH